MFLLHAACVILLAISVCANDSSAPLPSAYTKETIRYDGLRLDFSALTLNRDILNSIIPALARTMEHTFQSMSGSGALGSHISITEPKITAYVINEERLFMNRFEYNYPIYKLSGEFESIFFILEFNYKLTWIGIPISWGKMDTLITNLASSILVLWNETDPDVQIPHPWEARNFTTTSLLAPTSKIKEIIHNQFVPVFHKVVDDAMFDFAHVLLKNYKYIEDIFERDVDLVIQNEILSVGPSLNKTFFSIAFSTNITVDKKFHKKFFRRMNTTILPYGDFCYCFAAQLVPDVFDLLGRGKYYDREVPWQAWGFTTGTLKDLQKVVIGIENKFPLEDPFTITCSYYDRDSTIDLAERDSIYPLLRFQAPMECQFTDQPSATPFFVLDLYFRIYYHLSGKGGSFFGKGYLPTLEGISSMPLMQSEGLKIMTERTTTFLQTFDGMQLDSPGLKIEPTRFHQLKYVDYYDGKEEICFYFKEQKS